MRLLVQDVPRRGDDALDPLLLLFGAWFGFKLLAAHLPGRESMIAENSSHKHPSDFLLKAQALELAMPPIDPAIAELFLDEAGWPHRPGQHG